MSFESWIIFALFWAVFVTTPGPNAVNCISNGMTLGFRRSLVGVLAILTQASLFLALSAAGGDDVDRGLSDWVFCGQDHWRRVSDFSGRAGMDERDQARASGQSQGGVDLYERFGHRCYQPEISRWILGRILAVCAT